MTLPASPEQGVFKGARVSNVEVVGRFIQQQHVAAGDQGFRQMQSAAFAAGEVADDFLLVGAFEVKAADVGAAWVSKRPTCRMVMPSAISSNTARCRRARRAALVLGDFDGVADFHFAAIRLLCPVIMRNSVDLPAPLGPMMPTMAPAGF